MTLLLTDTVPPFDADAEMAVLGSLLLEADALGSGIAGVAALLRPEDFYKTVHGRIYEVILSLHAEGKPSDPIVVARECERRGILDEVGGREYLATLATVVPTASNAEHYARIVRDKATLSGARDLCVETLRAVAEGAGSDDVVGELEAGVLRISERNSPAHIYGGKDLAKDLREEWSTPPEAAPGIPTGLVDIDSLTTGLRPGQLVLIAGRPSMGKTTLALNIVRRATVELGRPSLFFSLEASRSEVQRNLAASISGVDTMHLHDPRRIRRSENDVLQKAADAIEAAPLHVCDDASLGLPTIRALALRMKLRKKIELAVIDYLQLVSVAGLPGVGRQSSREQQVAAISRGLKALARELEIPVVALCQLSRGPEIRDDHRPRLSDLRESGGLEADADLVLLMHRDDYYASNESEREAKRGVAEIIVAKNRNGPTDTVRVAYMAECARFGNLARERANRGGEGTS